MADLRAVQALLSGELQDVKVAWEGDHQAGAGSCLARVRLRAGAECSRVCIIAAVLCCGVLVFCMCIKQVCGV